jgi:hypothetical protein
MPLGGHNAHQTIGVLYPKGVNFYNKERRQFQNVFFRALRPPLECPKKA